jgi:Serine kinase of the HPr protein, regulates carbohydrate metabolism
MSRPEASQVAFADDAGRLTNSNSRSLEYFERVMGAAVCAEEKKGPIDRFISVSGETVRLRFAGGAMPSLIMPALEHLSSAPTRAPALTIRIWDSVSTGVAMPAPAWPGEAVGFRGEVTGFNDERISTAYQSHVILLSMFDSETNEGVYWIRNFESLPHYERAAPLLRIFHWWLKSRGQQVVHAASVGTSAGGVLIVGKGGAGKSNTALACMNAGLSYASDDYCVLSPGSEPSVWSLYNSGRTHAEDIERLPFLDPLVTNRQQLSADKALYFLHRAIPSKVINSFPLRAILLPRVTGRAETSLRPASASAGVLALSPSTMSQLPRSSRETVEIIAAVCRIIPAYHLELGTDRDQIPRVISGLLAAA